MFDLLKLLRPDPYSVAASELRFQAVSRSHDLYVQNGDADLARDAGLTGALRAALGKHGVALNDEDRLQLLDYAHGLAAPMTPEAERASVPGHADRCAVLQEFNAQCGAVKRFAPILAKATGKRFDPQRIHDALAAAAEELSGPGHAEVPQRVRQAMARENALERLLGPKADPRAVSSLSEALRECAAAKNGASAPSPARTGRRASRETQDRMF